MSNKNPNEAPADPASSAPPPHETQKERWLKYGANVALTVAVAVIVAVLVIYLGQEFHARSDTTASHSHSLSTATIDLLRGMNSKVKLVSLYSKAKRPEEVSRSGEAVLDPAIRYRE